MPFVERAAKAAAGVEWSKETQVYWENAARAALDAIEQPTYEMLRAGDDIARRYGWCLQLGTIEEMWLAMHAAMMKVNL